MLSGWLVITVSGQVVCYGSWTGVLRLWANLTSHGAQVGGWASVLDVDPAFSQRFTPARRTHSCVCTWWGGHSGELLSWMGLWSHGGDCGLRLLDLLNTRQGALWWRSALSEMSTTSQRLCLVTVSSVTDTSSKCLFCNSETTSKCPLRYRDIVDVNSVTETISKCPLRYGERTTK